MGSSALIATLGIVLAYQVKRFGYISLAVTGVAIVGIASLAGSYALGFITLLLTRIVEGFGWIVAAISLAPLLCALCTPRDQPLVMGLWGALFSQSICVATVLDPRTIGSALPRKLSIWLANLSAFIKPTTLAA